MVDVTDHELVPEHTVLDEEAVDEVLEEYNVRRTDLPKIKYNPSKRSEQDPALRALDQDVEPGDVVRIERDSRTAADTAVVYRLVVE